VVLKPSAISALTLVTLMMLTQSASADWQSSLPSAQLSGSGDFTWFGLRLYTARLWRAGAAWTWNEPFALELTYHRALSRNTLVQASIEEMQRLAKPPLASDTVERWSATLTEAFVDVRPGTRITGLYLPGHGCRFYVDGQLSLEVTDPALARAFFAIWLDPRSRDARLRERLLGVAAND
jgi:hypothetical protein